MPNATKDIFTEGQRYVTDNTCFQASLGYAPANAAIGSLSDIGETVRAARRVARSALKRFAGIKKAGL